MRKFLLCFFVVFVNLISTAQPGTITVAYCPTDVNVCAGSPVTYATPTFAIAPTNSLTSTMAAGNNHRGNMFDVQAINTVTITSFEAHPMGNTTIAIYYKTGSYSGFANNPAAWTLIGSATVTAQPFGTATPVPVPVNVTIPAGQTYAFYVTSTNTSVSLNYSNGTSEGNLLVSDANLRFYEGVGLEYPFTDGTGAIYTPRVWNGRINYVTGSGATVTRTAGLANGSVFPVGTTVVTHQATHGASTVNCSFNVVVAAAPTATITYAGMPFCATGTASPTITGTTGGTFSSMAGLNIDATTGVINLAASTTGTYTVTYTPPASGGCAGIPATTTVTINELTTVADPTDLTTCAGSATQAVTFSGTAITYSWTNNTPSIGLAASGSGNIAPFTAVNNGTAPVTATITVTPQMESTQIFNFTGGVQTFTVPAGITSIKVKAWGAQGGHHGGPNSDNKGGYTVATLAVTPGETIQVYVGGQATSLTGGFNGGGNGENAGIGGGGASDVRRGGTALANRVVVAGGGGGGGAVFVGADVVGGAGGGSTGGSGYRGDYSNPGGGGGTQTSSANGTCSSFNNPAVAGGFGFGGSALGCGCDGYGGGGGWYGGAGAGNCRGGGGGSSYVDPAATDITMTSGDRLGNGLVEISYSSNSCSGPSKTFTITVNPTPAITSAATGTICSGVAQNYEITSTVSGATFSWSRAAVTGISNVAASGTGNTITETLTNTTDAPVSVVYEITPSANSCEGPVFTYTVTVNPLPTVTSAATGTVCSGTAQNYTITSNVAGVEFTWTRAAVTGISNQAASKEGAAITETLTNTTSEPIDVVYLITPYADGCEGTKFTYTVTVNPGTAITTQPAAQAVCLGSDASFTVAATGTGLTYQWQKNGTDITGANSNTYIINNVTAAHADNYTVVVTGACGSLTSTAVSLTLKAPTTITTQPTAKVVCEGASATFTVEAAGSGTLTYQWKKDGAVTTSANAPTYTIPATTAAHAGTYTVDVTAACGTVASSGASLTVNPLPTASISGTTTICQDATAPFITFSGSNGTAPYTFTYTINGGSNHTVTTTSGNSVTVTVPTATPGTYAYQLVSVQDASATACANTASGTATVTVTALPTANLSYAGTPYCDTGTASPTFTGTTGGTYSSRAGLSINATTGVIDLAASTPGSYTVIYTIAAAGGCAQVQATTAVTIKQATAITTQPVAQTLCAGSSVTLSVAASGSNLAYQWRKGGTPITNATSNTYTIASAATSDAGAYDVVVTGDCGTLNSSSVNVVVNTAPTISTQPAGQVVCSGASASFSVTATGTGLTYQWQKDGAAIAGANGATYTINNVNAANSGNYTVVITGTCGTLTSAAAGLTVNAVTAIQTQPIAQTTCDGTSVSFSVTASGSNLTYQWRKGTTAIPGATGATYTIAAVTAADAGTYNVVVSGDCGSLTSASAALTVNTVTSISTQPVAQTVCAGGTATFSVAATGTNLTYQWYKAGAPINGATAATLSLPGASAATAGNYHVVVSGECGPVTSATAALTVLPTTTITTHPVSQVVCEGASVTFTGAAIGSGVSYKWQKDGTDIPGATSATYTLTATTAAAGNYQLVATSACGVATSTLATLTVNAIPATPTITAAGATTFCQGESVTLTSSAAAGNQWFKDGIAITGATAQTYTATVSGNYTAQSTISNCPSAISAAVTVMVKPLPATPVISATGNILTSSAASGNQWFLNSVAINGATGVTHRVQASGLYTVQVTENGCSALSAPYNFVATAIGTPATWNGTVTTYPNPVFQTLFVKNATGHKLLLRLFDGLGRNVYEGQLSGTEGRIPVTGLANGTYRLLITDTATNKTISQSIIKL